MQKSELESLIDELDDALTGAEPLEACHALSKAWEARLGTLETVALAASVATDPHGATSSAGAPPPARHELPEDHPLYEALVEQNPSVGQPGPDPLEH